MVEVSPQQAPPRRSAIAKWLVVIILAGVAAALLVELIATANTARAQTNMPSAGRNVIAVPGQVSRDTWGVYLVDLDNSIMSVYQYQTANRKLRLLACRNFKYDLQLNDYNTQPSPQEIKDYVLEQWRGGPTASRPVETEPAQEK